MVKKLYKPKLPQGFKRHIEKTNIVLQKLGKSLMFPIAVLPIAALMNRIGALLTDKSIGIESESVVWWFGQIIQAPGAAVFNNLSLIFAIGVAFGFAKDYRGEAALCGGISYMILTLMTKEGMVASLYYNNVLVFNGYKNPLTWPDSVWNIGDIDQTKQMYNQILNDSQQSFSQLLYVPVPFEDQANRGTILNSGKYVLDTGVAGGITCGCLTAYLYNRYKDTKLPMSLSFFGGRRFVPMITVVASFGLVFVFAAIWPWIQYALMYLGKSLSESKQAIAGGAWAHAFVNRLLQPFGAHHILNTFLWFQMPISGKLLEGANIPENSINLGNGEYMVFGDITAYNAGIIGSGIFQSGFFPVFFGGIPATGLAMILAARKEKRREVTTFIAGVAGVCFLTGIDEPIVFIWVFISPLLLLIHAFLTATFAAIVVGMGIRLGFGFSAGFIDYVISLPKSWAMAHQNSNVNTVLANPLWIFPLSAVMGAIYFFIWKFTIVKMNLQTPGREIDHDHSAPVPQKVKDVDVRYDLIAKTIVDSIGKDNFVTVDNCATRLRLVLKTNKLDIDEALKNVGVYQIIRIGEEAMQIIIGTDVEHVANRVRKLIGKE